MQYENIELSFLSIFALITFFIFLLSQKFINRYLLDQDFDKPQSFHSTPTPRCGGIAAAISLIVLILIINTIFNNLYYDFLLISLGLFLVGFIDDVKYKISPNLRLLLMIIILLTSINIFEIEIQHLDLNFLNNWLQNRFFSIFFISLCVLFIINGSNLVDGFNGLLAINLIFINSILLFINLENENNDFSFFLTGQLIILLSFLLFNFPTAKIFMGDGGSYLFGTLTSLNVIYTNNLNPNVSSFFFCILLFYLFFEVFFSFFRKIYLQKSPFMPDRSHLHMLVFFKLKDYFITEKSNYINSLLINFVFFIITFPSIFFRHNGYICKIWFLSLIVIYILIYLRLYRLTKK